MKNKKRDELSKTNDLAAETNSAGTKTMATVMKNNQSK